LLKTYQKLKLVEAHIMSVEQYIADRFAAVRVNMKDIMELCSEEFARAESKQENAFASHQSTKDEMLSDPKEKILAASTEKVADVEDEIFEKLNAILKHAIEVLENGQEEYWGLFMRQFQDERLEAMVVKQLCGPKYKDSQKIQVHLRFHVARMLVLCQVMTPYDNPYECASPLFSIQCLLKLLCTLCYPGVSTT
jgi:hypothetical protein